MAQQFCVCYKITFNSRDLSREGLVERLTRIAVASLCRDFSIVDMGHERLFVALCRSRPEGHFPCDHTFLSWLGVEAVDTLPLTGYAVPCTSHRGVSE